MSHTTSGVGVLWGAFHGELTTIISIGEVESTEVLDKAKKHAGVLAKLGSKMAAPVRSNKHEIEFASGGRILALPSSGGRGFTGNAFLDEFAYQQHAKEVYDAASAVTSLGFRLRVSSTPNGIGNEYHQLWERASAKDSSWSLHNVPIEVAVAQGYPLDQDKCWEIAKGDQRLYDQLFRCSFLDNEQQYIPSDLISAAETEHVYCAEGETFAGLDVGRSANLTVLAVLRRHYNIWWLVHLETCKRTDEQEIKRLASLAFSMGARRLCVDATGMGVFPADNLQKQWGRRVEPVTFTMNVKEELATTLFQAFADRTIRIPKDPELHADIASIRRVVTQAGNVRYEAPNTDKGHADRSWAIALGLHGASTGAGRKTEIASR